TGRCLATVRVPMSAGAMPDVVVVGMPIAPSSSGLTIGSNGKDYLVAWSDPPEGVDCCGAPIWRIYALRLGSDGAALGFQPALLDAKHGPADPHIVWGGGRYLVEWVETEAARAARAVR